jgi:hypothetical protein
MDAHLASTMTAQLQDSVAALESARAELWQLIDDSHPAPQQTLQSAVRYWAAVRRMMIWLAAHRRIHDFSVLPVRLSSDPD